MSKLEEYLNQDIHNPKYLFHGSPLPLKQLVPMQSNDSHNKNNEDKAVFLSSYFLTSASYAFSRKLKEINKYYDFNMNNNGELPSMSFAVETVPDDLMGYVYVFKKLDDMIKDDKKGSIQYRCYHSLIPDDVIEIRYKDFEKYFERLTSEEFDKKFPRR